jgi:hypothetical protein
MTLPLLPPQTGRSMSADTIGQNKVTFNLYCQQWQLLKEEKWQKGRRHDDGRRTTGIHMTNKQRSRGRGGVGSGDDDEDNNNGIGGGGGDNNNDSG